MFWSCLTRWIVKILTIFEMMVIRCVVFQIHDTIESINQLKIQRDFMLSFSNHPQEFIQDWIKSQCHDYKVRVLTERRIAYNVHNGLWLD